MSKSEVFIYSAFQTFFIFQQQWILGHKATMFTVYVGLCTQLCNEKVNLMEGLTTQCDNISASYLTVTTSSTSSVCIPTESIRAAVCHRLKLL